MKLYEPFHHLFTEVGTTNTILLELCKDKEMRKLLLRQQKAIAKALKDYHAIMAENNQD